MKRWFLNILALMTVSFFLSGCTIPLSSTPYITEATLSSFTEGESTLVRINFSQRTPEETVALLDVSCQEGYPVIFNREVAIPKGYTSVTLNVHLNNQFADPGHYHVDFSLSSIKGKYCIGDPSKTTITINI